MVPAPVGPPRRALAGHGRYKSQLAEADNRLKTLIVVRTTTDYRLVEALLPSACELAGCMRQAPLQLSALSVHAPKKIAHVSDHLVEVRFQQPMAAVEQMKFRIG